MTPLALAISRALIHFVWQGSIVGLSLWIVLFGLRKKSASSRYAVSCAALGLLAVMPVVTTWIVYIGSGGAISAAAPASQPFVVNGIVPYVPQALWLTWLQTWAIPLWSLGVGVFSLRLLLGYKHAFELRRHGKPATEGAVEVVQRLKRVMGVYRPIRVLISALSDSPSVVGWLRPVILLPPATLMGLTPLQLEAVLAHEIGHIKRYDYLVNIFQMLIETLFFYHPAIWWTSKRIRLERELCCDDLAVRFSGNALRYARALTTLEKLRLRATPGVVMASTGGPLLYRIQRLVGATTKEYGQSRLPGLMAIALGVLCFALNVTWIKGQDAPGVKVDLGSSSVIHRSPVPYPEAAQKQGVSGTVQLEVKLDSTGNVADARVLTGPEELRKAALESVLKWHFTSDAARGTRLITISFSEQGKQVQVVEPRGIAVTTEEGKTAFAAGLTDEDRKLEELKLKLTHAVLDNAKASEQTVTFLAQQLAATQAENQLTRRQELERAMGALRRKQEELKAGQPEERKAIEAKLDELKKEFEAAPLPAGRGGRGNGGRGNPFIGRALKGISTLGLSDAVRSDLILRLPVREGDTLSPQMVEQTGMAVRSYDEHLIVQFLVTNDGQAELRISAPGERR